MGDILNFETAKMTYKISHAKINGTPPKTKINKAHFDSFELKNKKQTPPRNYSFEDMVNLIGQERTREIFSAFIDDETNLSPYHISPPNGSVSLKDSLKDIWEEKEPENIRNEKRRQLARMSRAIKAFEIECSREHENIYGEKKSIELTLKNESGEEVSISKELRKQADFYKKNKVAATIDLVGQRINYAIICFLDSLKI